jgi:hypothetical protein
MSYEGEFDKAIDGVGVGLGIFTARRVRCGSLECYHTGNSAWLRRRATVGCRIVAAGWVAGEHRYERSPAKR